MSSSTTAPPAASETGVVATNSTLSGNHYLKLWDEALRKFEEQNRGADKSRRKLIDKLLKDLEGCETPDAVIAVLDQGMQETVSVKVDSSGWANLRDNYLLPAIKVISAFIGAFGDVATSAIPGGQVIFAAVAVLLKASRRCDEAYDTLRALFEGLHLSMESFGMRTAVSCMGTASKSVAVLVLVNLLDVLTLAIKRLPIKRRSRWFKFKGAISNYWCSLMQDAELAKAMQRMRELTIFETRAIATETQIEMAKVAPDTTKILQHTDTLSDLLTQLIKNSERDVEILRSIKAGVNGILEKIGRVDEADLRVQEGNSCLEDTRVDVLDKLQCWSSDTDADAPRIYWLNGMAGTGKSTIARSFGRYLEKESRLGGSFFCSRGDNVVLQNAKLIIPTLARALSSQDSAYRSALVRTLGREGVELRPVVWAIKDQVQKLFQEPFEALAESQRTILASRQLVMLIDALDETEGQVITDLLEALVTASEGTALPIKFFLTSRPEEHIRYQLMNLTRKSVLWLHDIEQEIVAKDIRRYVVHRFHNIVKRSRQRVSADWPALKDVLAVAELAGNLFIHAFTTTQYIGGVNPEIRLQNVLNVGRAAAKSASPLDDLDRIYSFIMESVRGEPEELGFTRRVLSAIITAEIPLSVVALAGILDVAPLYLRNSLQDLHSVLNVPEQDESGTLSTFHASFGDFISDPSRARPPDMLVKRDCGHFDLAVGCARIIKPVEHHPEMIYLQSRKHVPKTEISHIPQHVQYAYKHWPYHVLNGMEVNGIHLDILDIFVIDFTSWTRNHMVEDIGAAVQAHRHALKTISNLPKNVLSSSRTSFFPPQQARKLEDSDVYMPVLRRAIELAPAGHPDTPSVLWNIGLLFMDYFKRFGKHMIYLDNAISAYCRSCLLTPDDHPDMLCRLNTLAEMTIPVQDMHSYVTRRFEATIEMFRDFGLPSDWPASEDVQRITDLAGNSFIHAFTSTEYIRGGDPVRRLQSVLYLQDTTSESICHLDNIYKFVLGESMHGSDEELKPTRRILSVILTVRSALRLGALSCLLDMSVYAIHISLRHLHSVLHIPSTNDGNSVSILHKSFGDFLMDPHRAPPGMLVNPQLGHLSLAIQCAKILKSEKVYFDMSCFGFDEHLVLVDIPQHVQYACANWPYHVLNGTEFDGIRLDLEELFTADIIQWADVSRVDHVRAAIEAHRRRRTMRNLPHPDIPPYMSDLGGALSVRFMRKGELADIHVAIFALRRAVELVPVDHPDLPTYLANLCNSLLIRFESTHTVEDVEEAIVAMHRASYSISGVQIDSLSHASDSGVASFMRRFERNVGDDEDTVQDAIMALYRAVSSMPEGRLNIPEALSAIGHSYVRHVERLSETKSIDAGIVALRRAVDLMQEDHPDRTGAQSKLDMLSKLRSEHIDEVKGAGATLPGHGEA
ncbi:hypothetical protein PENSPDRAFT_758505 [Peniophora sp. CONT]|nr:hypothetical protein PENSPDRAFT_758505 [Peniophora sp. CONT]